MEFIIFLMMLFVGWVLFKVFKWIFIFLGIICVGSIAKANSASKKRQKPVVKNEEPLVKNNIPIIENKEPIIGNKPPKLKYENVAYVSLRDMVYKAFEAYKDAGEKVSWELERDGFSFTRKISSLMEDETFSVCVEHDNNNQLSLTDPYYLCITYSFSIKKDKFDYYKNLANYINDYYKTHNMLSKELFVIHSVFTIEYSDIGSYTCYVYVTDINYLCSKTKVYGEAHVFDVLFRMAEEKFVEGQELYRAR